MRSTLAAVCSIACVFMLFGCGGSNSTTSANAVPAISSQSDLANPPEVTSANGVAVVQLAAAINPQTGGPGIEYNGQFTPPTIRVSPGDTIDLTYVNQLPTTNAEPFNATNIHFHGLHVSPNPPSDDAIDLLAMPGQTLHYVVQIPKDHPTGLFWYHSHSHGESNWQLYNGMSGAIVVNGIQGFSPEAAGVPDRVIVLRNVLAHPDYSTLSEYRRALAQRRHALGISRSTFDDQPAVCGQPFGIDGEYTTINGQLPGGNIAFSPGQSQLWRVVNASADGYYDVSIDGASLRLIGLDGVPVVAYPGGTVQNVSHVVIPPAGRAEFLVSGASAGAAVRTSCFDTGPDGDPNPSQVLGTIVSKTTAIALTPNITTQPPTGIYAQAMSGYAQERTVTFTEDDSGFYLNGGAYNPQGPPLFTATSGTVERWTLVNTTGEVHAFHIHQTHFIVQDVDGVVQQPALRDTVTVPYVHSDGTPGVVHVLIDFRDPIIRGTFLFHCHLLEHEDGGMMAKIQVQ